MNPRTNHQEKAVQYLRSAGVEKPEELIDAFAQLEELAKKGWVEPTNIKQLIQKIGQYHTCDLDLLCKGVKQLAKSHPLLFSYLIHLVNSSQKKYKKNNYKSTEQSQIHFNKCIQFIKQNMIQPILWEMADQTDYAYFSKYFGKISIVSFNDELKTRHELHRLDSALDEYIAKLQEETNQPCALQAYAHSFFYLNKENLNITTRYTKKSLADYLEEFGENNQGKEKRKISPRIMIAANEIIRAACIDKIKCNSKGVTYVEKQTIALSLEENRFSHEFLITLIHEIQHWFNSLYINYHENTENFLSLRAIHLFIDLTNKIKFPNKTYENISKELQNILKFIVNYKQSERSIDELSCHLTSLLFLYSPETIRIVINLTIENLSTIIDDNQTELMLIAKSISTAFSFVEYAIVHFAQAQHQFMINKTKEELKFLVKRVKIFDLMATLIEDPLKNASTISANKTITWQQCLQNIAELEFACQRVHQIAVSYNSIFSIHQQVVSGDDAMIELLYHLNKASIDEYDNQGFTPIACAVKHDNDDTFQLLEKFGANLSWEGVINEKNGNTLLHLAAYYGSYKMIPLLIKKGFSAEALNSVNQSPLFLLTQFINTHYTETPNVTNAELDYSSCITALVYLLSYSIEINTHVELTPENEFFHALINFRKSFATLLLLYESGNLILSENKIPSELVMHIAMQLNYPIPNKAFQNCYHDIVNELTKDKKILLLFAALGIDHAYIELTQSKSSITSNNNLPNKLYGLFSTNENTLTNSQKKKTLIDYYTPRKLAMGAKSLAAITLAQQQISIQYSSYRYYFSLESHYNARRLAIQQYKSEIAHGDHQKLVMAIIQACKDLDISEINENTYKKIANVLRTLVKKNGVTPENNAPFFKRQFKDLYKRQERSLVSRQHDRSSDLKTIKR